MLNSFEIAHALEDLGFVLDNDNTHAWGYLGPEQRERIYVKAQKNKYEDTDWHSDSSVKKQPLVLSTESILSAPMEKAIRRTDPQVNTTYKNHNLTWLNSDHQKLGVALGVSNKATLKNLLEEIGYLKQEPDPLDDIEQQEPTFPDNPTEREALRKSRLGQGVFRKRLEQLWDNKCSVTMLGNRSLLRASHMKPWSISSNEERLDPENGLLLMANLDAAFDSGLISFNDSGNILISAEFPESEASSAGIYPKMTLSKPITDAQKQYLLYHRKNVFRN